MSMFAWLVFYFAVASHTWTNGVVTGMEKIEGTYDLNEPGEERAETIVTIRKKHEKSKLLGVRAICQNDSIGLRMNTTDNFTGMIYSLNSNGNCMAKYVNVSSSFNFTIPLKGCNTRTLFLEDGMELYNVFVIQTHTTLLGPGAKHIGVACKFLNYIQTMSSNFKTNFTTSDVPAKVANTSPGPKLFMRILAGNSLKSTLASKVSVGQNLTLVIGMENNDMYSLKVFNCSVDSGVGETQQLHDENGCAVDRKIMKQFSYSQERNLAFVNYKAHKFPNSNFVYYSCSVKLYSKERNIQEPTPPMCPERPDTRNVFNNKERIGASQNRHARQFDQSGSLSEDDGPKLGLTPEMVQKLFYKNETSMDLNIEIKVDGMIQLGNSTDPTAYKSSRNDTFLLEFGIRVVDADESNASEDMKHATTSSFSTWSHQIDILRCWPEIRIPVLILTSSGIITSIGLVFLCVQVHKLRSYPSSESEADTVETPESTSQNIPSISEPIAFVDFREFRRCHGLRHTDYTSYRRQLSTEEFHRGAIRGKTISRPRLVEAFLY